MTQAYKNFSIIPVDLLPSRQTFLDGATDSPEMFSARMDLLRLDENGVPDEENIFLEVQVLHIQAIQLPQQERMQANINSSDDGQAYFFGRENRVYQVSSFLVDSNLSPGQGYKVDQAFQGHLLGRWKNLYEKLLRVTQTLRNRRVVRIRFKTTDLYGHILSAVASMDSSQPFLCQVAIMFLCVYERDRAPIPVIDANKPVNLEEKLWPSSDKRTEIFPGMLTKEGWAALVSPLIAEVKVTAAVSVVEKAAKTRISIPPWT